MPNIVPIVEVAPDAPELVRAAFAAILPGSIAVAVARNRAVVVDFESGLCTRPSARPPSEAEQTEYALRAAGRAAQRYPTVARFSLPDWQPLRVVGAVDTQSWAVALRRPEPLFLIDGMPLPDELLPLRLFKCARGCWLVIPGLCHDRPAVYWPA